MSQSDVGDLYVVATPIGNLGDITRRAEEVLRSVDVIAAEDTRVTGRLLTALDIHDKPMVACHDHNETDVARLIVDRLKDGRHVALVSDAGTPLISDPGYRVVNAVIEAGLRVVPVPGPSALMAALSVSGMSTDSFLFCGFLPAKSAARRNRLSDMATQTTTLVVYEAPHRVSAMLADISDVMGSATEVVLCRELTKQYEQVWRGQAQSAADALESGLVARRGEFVLLITPPGTASNLSVGDRRLLEALLKELSPSRASRVASEVTGLDKRVFYELAMALKDDNQ